MSVDTSITEILVLLGPYTYHKTTDVSLGTVQQQMAEAVIYQLPYFAFHNLDK